MAAKPFHLGWFLQGSSVQAWGEPWTGHIGRTWMVPELFTDMARSLERACFDYILIEDSSYVGESFGGSTEIYLKNAIAVPRQDPSVVASLMTAVTSRIGIVPTFGTYAYPPYLLARLVASLDQVSSGRIGWNAVTGSSDFAAMNFGLPGMPEHDLRYDMADEYMQAVNALWDSWEPGAIIADRHSGVLVDPAKVRAANHEGRFFKTRGPLNSGPAPQGRPVIAQAGGSPRGRQFAAQHADTIVAHTKGIAAMKSYRDDVRGRMTACGRDPDRCKVLFLVAPIIGFALKQRGVDRATRARLVDQSLELVRLLGYQARYPRQLSGGQQQSVALARSIVFRPRLLLMDEPLGALDKQLRESLQLEMRRLHADLGITFIYVTHDQEEALTMSDRIAVMNEGLIAQVGSLEDIYDRPCDRFVAAFIGESNFLTGVVRGLEDGLIVAEWAGRTVRGYAATVPWIGAEVTLSTRPERMRFVDTLAPEAARQNRLRATVTEAVFVGERCRYLCHGEGGLPIVLKEPSGAATRRRTVGETVDIAWSAADTVVV